MDREKRTRAADSFEGLESEPDSQTIGDIVERLDDQDDAFVTPWKRSYSEAFRSVIAN
jgi:hypothetical protein